MKKLIIALIFGIFVVIAGCDYEYAGSFCGREIYALDMSSKQLVEGITAIKEEHPEYNVVRSINDSIVSQDHAYLEYWYVYHFCVPMKDTVIVLQTVVDMRETGPTNYMLLGVTYDKKAFRGYKRMKDIPKKERTEIEHVFEKYVLSELRKYEAPILQDR